MRTIKVKIAGLRPLLLHNGLMADPTNFYVREIKKITSKGAKKMTDADYAERDRLEWEAGLYWSSEIRGIAIPSDNLERCIQEGVILGTSTPLDELTEEERWRHETVLEKMAIRAALFGRKSVEIEK